MATDRRDVDSLDGLETVERVQLVGIEVDVGRSVIALICTWAVHIIGGYNNGTGGSTE